MILIGCINIEKFGSKDRFFSWKTVCVVCLVVCVWGGLYTRPGYLTKMKIVTICENIISVKLAPCRQEVCSA